MIRFRASAAGVSVVISAAHFIAPPAPCSGVLPDLDTVAMWAVEQGSARAGANRFMETSLPDQERLLVGLAAGIERRSPAAILRSAIRLYAAQRHGTGFKKGSKQVRLPSSRA